MINDPRAVLSDWDYKEIIRMWIPTLIEATAIDGLALLIELLREALESQQSGEADSHDGFLWDYSTIWRSNLAPGERSANEDVLNALVTGVRAASLQIVGETPELLDQVVESLERHRWTVLWRISLDVLREVGDPALELACARLTNASFAQDHWLEAEYVELLQAAYPGASVDCQDAIRRMIAMGPNTAGLSQGSDSDGYVRLWRWRLLTAIKDHLPPLAREQWIGLATEFGEETGLRREGVVSTWVGHPQAVGADRLGQMELDEIVEFVNAFESGAGFNAPSAGDLARELGQAAAADPSNFGGNLTSFYNLGLVYKAGLMQGFRDAAEAGGNVRWDRVLELARRIVWEAGYSTDDESVRARREVIDLLHSGLAPKGTEISFDWRPVVWEILATLLEDPNPSTESEGPTSGLKPYELAINSNRGRALEAAIYYGTWIFRHTKTTRRSDEVLTFTDAPELTNALARRLDTSIEASPAVRSVFGVYLSQLNGLDHGWAIENLALLLPPGENAAALRKATWDAYVSYGRLNLSMLDLLKGEYAKSIELITGANSATRNDPEERLGQHLLIFYLKDRLAIDDPMIVRFFENTDDHARAKVTADVGQDLRRITGPYDEDMAERNRSLWDWRIRTAESGRAEDCREEMTSFGWTFASGKLGDDWGLLRLETVLLMTGQAELDHLVAERLAVVASADPLSSLRCFGLMVDGAKESWQIQHWAPSLEAVLQAGLTSGDRNASEAANALINKLAARGFLHFAKILEDS